MGVTRTEPSWPSPFGRAPWAEPPLAEPPLAERLAEPLAEPLWPGSLDGAPVDKLHARAPLAEPQNRASLAAELPGPRSRGRARPEVYHVGLLHLTDLRGSNPLKLDVYV